MLIIMEDRQYFKAIKAFFDVEALRGFDILEVNSVKITQQFND